MQVKRIRSADRLFGEWARVLTISMPSWKCESPCFIQPLPPSSRSAASAPPPPRDPVPNASLRGAHLGSHRSVPAVQAGSKNTVRETDPRVSFACNIALKRHQPGPNDHLGTSRIQPASARARPLGLLNARPASNRAVAGAIPPTRTQSNPRTFGSIPGSALLRSVMRPRGQNSAAAQKASALQPSALPIPTRHTSHKRCRAGVTLL